MPLIGAQPAINFNNPQNLSLQSYDGSAVQPVGNAWRGFDPFGFSAADIAEEDWLREQQAQDLALGRDIHQMNLANAFTAEQNQLNRDFNASEAQKQRDYDERMARNKYTYAVQNLKEAGLNPILALDSGMGVSSAGSSAVSASGSTASAAPSSRFGTSKAGLYANSSSLIGGILQLAGILLTKGKTTKIGKVGFGN